MPRVIIGRTARAVLLMFAVSSTALLLVHLAPGDAIPEIGVDPASARAQRARLGLDRPFLEQYTSWLGRAMTLDFGESTRFRRPVASLLAERLPRTLSLGLCALAAAMLIGGPIGVASGATPHRWWAKTVRAVSMMLVSLPPLVMSLVLLMIASRTGWLPAAGGTVKVLDLVLPTLALALPIAATLERLQSAAVAEAMKDPSVRAALARGISHTRTVWNHAFRLSLKPVLAVLGIIVGSVLSGSFVVEIITSWPGVGDLMYQALIARDVFLAAGCAAAASLFLALGVLLSDLALAAVDPRLRERS